MRDLLRIGLHTLEVLGLQPVKPPNPRAGRQIVGIPAVIVPALRGHLAVFVKDDPKRAKGRTVATR